MAKRKAKVEHVSEGSAKYGTKRRTAKSKARPKLAPDGLPWPEGYFDRVPPRVTLEEAMRDSGVRPKLYRHGVPVYDEEDCSNSNYKFPFPPEPEWVAEILAAAEKREKNAGK